MKQKKINKFTTQLLKLNNNCNLIKCRKRKLNYIIKINDCAIKIAIPIIFNKFFLSLSCLSDSNFYDTTISHFIIIIVVDVVLVPLSNKPMKFKLYFTLIILSCLLSFTYFCAAAAYEEENRIHLKILFSRLDYYMCVCVPH